MPLPAQPIPALDPDPVPKPLIWCNIIFRFSRLRTDTDSSPGRHLYILTKQSDAPENAVNFWRAGPDRFFLDIQAVMLAQGGLYRKGTVDWQEGPLMEDGEGYDVWTFPAPQPCSVYEASFADTITRVNRARIWYNTFTQNSNSFAYTMLKRAGLPTPSMELIRGIIGGDAFHGWGEDLSSYFDK
jgi:hypothetical protein